MNHAIQKFLFTHVPFPYQFQRAAISVFPSSSIRPGTNKNLVIRMGHLAISWLQLCVLQNCLKRKGWRTEKKILFSNNSCVQNIDTSREIRWNWNPSWGSLSIWEFQRFWMTQQCSRPFLARRLIYSAIPVERSPKSGCSMPAAARSIRDCCRSFYIASHRCVYSQTLVGNS